MMRWFWVLVRLAGIIVGTATLLRLALTEGLVTYEPIFQAWMDRLRDIIELGFLTDVIELALVAAFEWARGFGIPMPELQPEWRPAFILTALLFGAIMRHNRGQEILFIGLAVLTAILAAGVTGNVAMGFFSILFLIAGFNLISQGARRFLIDRDYNWLFSQVIGPMIIGVTYFSIVLFFNQVFSDGGDTIMIFILVAMLGAQMSWRGITKWRPGKYPLFRDANFSTGIDILSAMGLALALATMFAKPPIW